MKTLSEFRGWLTPAIAAMPAPERAEMEEWQNMMLGGSAQSRRKLLEDFAWFAEKATDLLEQHPVWRTGRVVTDVIKSVEEMFRNPPESPPRRKRAVRQRKPSA